jgi:oligopeptidase B
VPLQSEPGRVTQAPPVAEQRPAAIASPHGTRHDEYAWLRDDERTDPDVLAYLAAENAYREAALAHVKPLEDRLYEEIVARIRQDDSTVPYRHRGHWHYARYESGAQYPIYARKAGSLEAPEEVLLDLRELGAGHDFYELGDYEVSPDNRLLAYTEDTVGRRQYTLRIKDLASGQLLADAIENVEDGIAWSADSRTVLYVEKDPQTLLGLRVRKHVLGTDPAQDVLVHEEQDDAFYTSVATTKDGQYLLIESSSTVTTETRYARADDPALDFKVLQPRRRGHEYSAEHRDGHWIIRTNWRALNFRLMQAAVPEAADIERWTEIVAHREDALLAGFDVFRDFIAIEERSGGLRKVRLLLPGREPVELGAGEAAYRSGLGANEEMDSAIVRYTYTSLTTPASTYDYDVTTGTQVLLKREPVLGDFDPGRYVTEYLRAPARDGRQVPIAVVHRRGLPRDGTAPMLQHGYGAYGISTDPAFSSTLLSLLDRGFVYAIAQVRGGQELGRRWYDDGRLLAKRNSFDDFIDATRFLVREGYADPRRVFARGGSAGGLLMGAVVNQAPADYRAVVAHVPFVDIVTSMLDDSLPLTTNEYDEWGNPNEREFYEYMLSYSPYDNVSAQAYPAMLVTTGLWDSQVQYFEPAKWVARLRRLKTDDNLLLLRVNMEAGHGGKSGRFHRYREIAEEYAFLLDQAGITQ